MRKFYSLLCAIVLVFSGYKVSSQCGNGRYYNKIFSPSTSTVTYGNAMKADSSYTDLKMDIYQPSGDTLSKRPLMVLAFPGSFTAGSRLSPDITTLCDNFVRRGYVCASIDYRLGFDYPSDCDTNQFKALMRGVQDMKAAVRFFYKDAQTVNTYRIDTNFIFIGGSSAGAFIGLNYAYGKLDTLSRSDPPWARPALDSLGGPEGNSGNPGYSSKVKGVIDLCGAIADTVWIMPGDPVLVGVHGTADKTVSCYYDSVYALTHPESLLFGGGDVLNRLNHIPGPRHSMYLFQGADHVPYILPCILPQISPCKEYMDTTVWVIRDFLYQVVCDTAFPSAVEDVIEQIPVSIFPNPAEDIITVSSGFDRELQMKIFSVDGKMIKTKMLEANGKQTLSRSELGSGIFILQVSDNAVSVVRRIERLVFY